MFHSSQNLIKLCRYHGTLLHGVLTKELLQPSPQCRLLSQISCKNQNVRTSSPLLLQNKFKQITPTWHRWASTQEESQQKEIVDHIPSYYDRYVFPEPPDLVSEEEHDFIVSKVNEAIASPDVGRLFAIIQIGGKQYKITDDDLIRIDSYLPADIGERIRLEKVLLCGGKDFTLVGRPLLRRSLVKVEATVIEKTPGFEKIMQYFRKLRFKRKKIYTPKHTVLRINSIEAYPQV